MGELVGIYDGVHQTPDYQDSGIMFLSVENIATLKSEKYISEAAFERDYKVYPEKGDILMTRIGDVGTTNVVETAEKVAFYVSLALLKPNGIDSYFLSNAMKTNPFLKGLRERTLVTAIPQKINKDEIGKIDIFITNNDEEQKKIGAYFHNLDNLITLHQRKCEQTKNLKKYMLQKMFPQNGAKVPEIRFNGFTHDWEQRKLGDMGSTYTGLSGKTKEDFGHGDAKFITYMNVFSNPVANLDMTESVEIDSKQNCVKAGDVFFTTSSETPEEVGMSSVMPENADNIYLNSFCFGYRPTEKFDLNYLAYVLRTESFRKEMTFLAQGISRYNISKNKVMEVEIPIPSLDEQSRVGQYFKNLDTLITLHQRKCDELKKMKKFMLQNMFI